MTQHPLSASAISRLERLLADARAIDHHVHVVARVLGIHTAITNYDRNLSISPFDPCIALWINYPHVLADPEDLRALAIAGYHQRTHSPALTDKGSGTTTYYLFHEDWKNLEAEVIRFHAGLREDAPTCRRVQIGTRTETYPVYEVQCSPDDEQ